MAARKKITDAVAAQIMVACRRRCCMCYALKGKNEDCKGQLAHLNRRREDGRIENLAYLCLDHHNDYDTKWSQTKRYTATELKHYRDELVAAMVSVPMLPEAETLRAAAELVAEIDPPKRHPWKHAWRHPLWLAADQPELFAYSAPGADGVCSVERIDLPDGRVVIACVEMRGNPGQSITNAAEYVFAQICQRFELKPQDVVWLEHYEYMDEEIWRLVEFDFEENADLAVPTWTDMTSALWEDLRLSPRKRLTANRIGVLPSRLRKHFRGRAQI